MTNQIPSFVFDPPTNISDEDTFLSNNSETSALELLDNSEEIIGST